MKTIGNYIAGSYTASTSDRKLPVYNPATGEQSAQVSLSTVTETQAAIDVAQEAFASWSQVPPLHRARVMFAFNRLLEERNDELVEAISREHGKVWGDAQGEVIRGKEVVEFACGIPQLLKGEYSFNVGSRVDTCTMHQPLGVCAGITPFNFPAMVPMWMFPIAIACGNTFVLKPSEKDPSTPLLLAEILSEAGLPDGVFNVINGDKESVDTLLQSNNIAAVSFVGSTPVARYIHQQASAHGKRVQALGGAKNHMVVMPDADLENVASSLIGAAFGSAGERCMAISVAVLVGDVADDLIPVLKEKITKLCIGPGYTQDSHYDFGPVISKAHKEKILGLIEKGIQEGAELIVDGRDIRIKGFENGYFIGACVFDKVTQEMTIYKEEIFGPVLSVVRVDTMDEALKLVNDNQYGNGTSICTSNGSVARQFSTQCNTGMVGVNVPIPVPVAFHSFGGWKDSFFGDHDMHGTAGVRFYTHSKKVTSRWPDASQQLGNQFHMPTPGH